MSTDLTDPTGSTIIRHIASPDAPETITPESVATLPPYHPARRLAGATIDWSGHGVQRMPGDDLHYPGVMADGRPVRVSRALTYYYCTH